MLDDDPGALWFYIFVLALIVWVLCATGCTTYRDELDRREHLQTTDWCEGRRGIGECAE